MNPAVRPNLAQAKPRSHKSHQAPQSAAKLAYMTFLVPSSQGAQIFPFRKYPPAHAPQYGPACNVQSRWQRVRK